MNLSELQAPQIIEELSFEEILQQMKEALVAIDSEYTAYLGSDPLMKLFEIAAYREVLLRQRINQAAKANLLAFATGSDLDNLAAFYGIVRKENETFDESLLDEGVLSDDSGIRLTENGPKLSFGRVNTRAIEIPSPVASAAASREHFITAKNIDAWRLDFATFDDLSSDAINRKAVIERERSVFNVDPVGKIPSDLLEPRHFSKSSMVLSEDAAFDDINATFGGDYDEIEEEPFILSFTPLSSGKRTVRRIFIDEYFLREKSFRAISDFEYGISNGIRERERSVELEYAGFASVSTFARSHSADVEYKGADTWRDHRHFNVPWKKCSGFTPIWEATE